MVSESSRLASYSAADSLVVSSPQQLVPEPATRAQESVRQLPPQAAAAAVAVESAAKAPEISRAKASEFAKEIEQALNDSANNTVVKFNVSLVEEASQNSFKFQIVDKSTGKVVRQFPPEDILNIRDRIKATPPQGGVLIDSAV
jgi:uncharacterized FlaG/YvyC family protein